MGSWFEAKRDGSCGKCGAPVITGEPMYAVRKGMYVCQQCGQIAEELPPDSGPMVTSVLSNLDEFPPEVREGSLAQSMLYMARQLDMGEVAARDVAPFIKEIRQSYMQLRALYPPLGDEDETDLMAKRREERFRYDEDRDR
jgi:hypothetical protein